MLDAILGEVLRELPKQFVGALVDQGVGTIWKKITEPDRRQDRELTHDEQQYAAALYEVEQYLEGREIVPATRPVTDHDVDSAVAVADWFFTEVRNRRFANALNACHTALSESFHGRPGLQRRFHRAPRPEPWSFSQYCVHAGDPETEPVLQLIGTICFGGSWTAFSLWMALENEEWRLSGWDFDFQGNVAAA